MRWPDRGRLGWGANAILMLAAAVAGLAAFDAWEINPAPIVRSSAPPRLEIRKLALQKDSSTTVSLVRAVNRDPFRPDRRPASSGYRLPGEPPPPKPPNLSGWKLVGTAALGGGEGIAAITIGTDSRIYHVGDSVAELELIRVETGVAELSWGDTTFVLTSSAPQARR